MPPASLATIYLPNSFKHLLPLIRARIWSTGNVITGRENLPCYPRRPEASVGIRLKAVCAGGRTGEHTCSYDVMQRPASRAPSGPHSISFWLWFFLYHFPLPVSLLKFLMLVEIIWWRWSKSQQIPITRKVPERWFQGDAKVRTKVPALLLSFPSVVKIPILLPSRYNLQPPSLLLGGLVPSEAADTALNPAQCIAGEDAVRYAEGTN